MKVFMALALLLGTAGLAHGALTVYTSETEFLNDLSLLGYEIVQEGFEDDAAWGSVRTTTVPHTAASITNLGVTWTANNPNGGVTTGNGPAHTGEWGFFCLPHGDYPNGIRDGFIGTTAQSIFGVGGWLVTNTPGAKIVIILDGVRIADFGDRLLGNQHDFYGVIDTDGFLSFEVNETEGTFEDQKFIFADDFSFTPAELIAISDLPAPPARPGPLPNRPNPFTTATTLRYELSAASRVTLQIRDASGRLVRELCRDAVQAAGRHAIRWDGTDSRGRPAASGVYFSSLKAEGKHWVRRMVLVR